MSLLAFLYILSFVVFLTIPTTNNNVICTYKSIMNIAGIYDKIQACLITGIAGMHTNNENSILGKVYYFSSFKDFNTISRACI